MTKKSILSRLALVAFLCCVGVSQVGATTYYVDPSVSASGVGTNWGTAFKSIGEAEVATGVTDIYVKGGTVTLTQNSTYTLKLLNYYGGFAGNEANPTQRPKSDLDGNGIVESWEFSNPTVITGSYAANPLIATIASTVLDGFTLYQNGGNASTPLIKTGLSSSSFQNVALATIKNCTLSGSNLTYNFTGSGPGGCLIRNYGTIQDCLIANNYLSLNILSGCTVDSKVTPILENNGTTSDVIVSRCVFRNNRADITSAAPKGIFTGVNFKGLVINLQASTDVTNIKVSDCLVYNNQFTYTNTASSGGVATLANASVLGQLNYSTSKNIDWWVNNTIANNTMTNCSNAAFSSANNTLQPHKIYNNVFWGNKNNNTVVGLAAVAAQPTGTVVDNNVMDVVETLGGAWGTGFWGANNKTNLSSNNSDGSNGSQFKKPTTNTGFLSDGTVEKADWRLNSGSYLFTKGASTATTTISGDKAGNNFAASPAAGAYEATATAPTISGITALNASLNVVFTIPAYDGGSAITNYKYSTDGGASFTACSTPQTTSPISITGLTNGTSYNVQIKAVNANGDGIATASSVAVPVATSTTPSVPTINSVTSASAQLIINYTPGSDGGSAITGYKYSTDGGVNFVDIATASPLVITTQSTSGTPSLVNGTSYSVQIKAVNANGSSVATVSTTATPSGQAAAPTIGAITPSTTSLSVAFTAGSDGGSTITNYKYSIDGGATFMLCNPTQTTSPIVISNLNAGTAYNVQLLAVNAYGNGTATATSAVSTTSTTPSAPLITGITPSSTSLSVAFTAPSANGSAITSYKYSTDGGTSWRTRASGTTATPIVIGFLSTNGTTALTNGTAYNVQIKAVNGNGDGTASQTSICVPVASATTPAAPTISAINVASATLYVIITPGSTGNSALTNYKYSTDGGATWFTRTPVSATSPLAITLQSASGTPALVNGTAYSVQIKAVNANGDSPASNTFVATPQSNNQTISFTAPTKNYGDANFAPASATSGLPVTYASSNTAVATIVSGNIHIVGVGTSSITASQAGNATNNAAPDVIQTLTVNPKALSIGAASIASKVYDGSPTSGTVTPGSLSGLVSPETLNVSAVGTYPDANVGTGKSATIVYSLTDGTGLAANYSLANGSATGDITAIPSSPASGSLGSASTLPGTDVTVASGVALNVTNNATVHSITVQPGGMLTLADGNTLTAPLVLQNTGSATASFIDGNSGNSPTAITATVQQDIPAKDRNWYVSVPVSGKTASNITLLGAKIVTRNEANVTWDDVTAGTTLTPGVGYIAVASASTGTTSWSLNGNLNNGSVPVTLSAAGASFTGFNLVGNPYPSYLNWEQVLNLSSANAALVQPTIWYRTASWNNTTTKYDYTFQTYNSASRIAVPISASGYIPPMQAFWVRANAGGTLTFTNAMRSHGDGTTGFGSSNLLKAKSTVTSAQPVLRLQVNNTANNTSYETVVYFNPNAQNGYDAYDSPKMMNNSATVPDIYTNTGKDNLVINGMNAIPYDTEIPLGFAPGSGTLFQLKATELTNFESGTQVLLNDKATGAVSNLAAGDTYTFDNSVSAAGRFSLVFKAPSAATGINSNNVDVNISIFRNGNGQITVSCPTELTGKATMSVYNAVGQKLENKQLTSAVTVITNAFESGVYVVTVVANGKTITRKVVIN